MLSITKWVLLLLGGILLGVVVAYVHLIRGSRRLLRRLKTPTYPAPPPPCPDCDDHTPFKCERHTFDFQADPWYLAWVDEWVEASSRLRFTEGTEK